METSWHSLSAEHVLNTLDTKETGLTSADVQVRIEKYGPNSLPEKKPPTWLELFIRQFNSSLIFVLLAAAIAIYAIGHATDAWIILGVLIFNAIVGMIQEGRAENTLSALKNFVQTKATVLRDGKELVVSDVEVVPGDIILLQEGEKVPADARVLVSHNLKVDEAALTGESQSVHKTAEVIKQTNIATGDKKNILFKGTHVVAGNGRAVVIATGSNTMIGKIAKEISAIDTEIPLKANIRALSHSIIYVVVGISLLLFVVGIVRGESVEQMFATVVSLAVSIIPEGLPIVITLVLASGVWRMSRKNALVKKLQAVEALGQARVIAVDKTGTITKNEMVVEEVWVAEKTFKIGGVGYEPKGEVELEGAVIDAANHPELLHMAKVIAMCANARISYLENEKKWSVGGDPTEAAMVVFAEKMGFKKEELLRENPPLLEVPFDYKLKYHASINSVEGKNFLTIIGAPEVVLKLSKLSEKEYKEYESIQLRMSEKGRRVVAVGVHKSTSSAFDSQHVPELTFVGFLGLLDTLRPEVEEATKRAQEAGIRVVMITGDHKVTAKALAKQAGIYHDGDEVLTGVDLETLSEGELVEKLARTSVFARVTPEHKLKIIMAFKKRGEIIAMTGDGVNDAPSLVAADLGVAMGTIGTEVAKEAADIVLMDDNFGNIVLAVEEGRSIYRTIKKVILYLFSTSLGEMFTIMAALFFGFPLPLLAAQIIWLNFVTDGFLVLALAMEPKEKELLSGSFEKPKKYLVDKEMFGKMILMSLPMMLGTLYLFNIYAEVDMTKALTISLTTLAVFQWFNAWNCRSETKSVFWMNPFSNPFLILATLIVIGLQLLAVYSSFFQNFLHTTSLSLSEWVMIISISTSVLIVEEIRKLYYRIKHTN